MNATVKPGMETSSVFIKVAGTSFIAYQNFCHSQK